MTFFNWPCVHLNLQRGLFAPRPPALQFKIEFNILKEGEVQHRGGEEQEGRDSDSNTDPTVHRQEPLSDQVV